MKRIAQIYFPLIPIVLAHVSRLNSGHAPYISPMLGAASMQGGGEKNNSLGSRIPSSPSATDSLPRSFPGSEFSTQLYVGMFWGIVHVYVSNLVLGLYMHVLGLFAHPSMFLQTKEQHLDMPLRNVSVDSEVQFRRACTSTFYRILVVYYDVPSRVFFDYSINI